jgi:hypothetical protein
MWSSRTGTRPTINSSRRPPPDAATSAAASKASATAATHCVEATAATHRVAAAASTAAAASVAAAAAASSHKLEAGRGQCGVFPVEDVERRQTDVEDFFFTEGEFVTRFRWFARADLRRGRPLVRLRRSPTTKVQRPPRLVRLCSDAFASKPASRATWKGLLRAMTRIRRAKPAVHTKQVSFNRGSSGSLQEAQPC